MKGEKSKKKKARASDIRRPSEIRRIVDLMATRKNHSHSNGKFQARRGIMEDGLKV
jgi:hypothetical protein